MLVDIGEELKREQVLLGDDVTPEGERRRGRLAAVHCVTIVCMYVCIHV